MENTLPVCLKHKMYDEYIMPAMTYKWKTWKLTKLKNKLKNAFRSMEKATLRTTLIDSVQYRSKNKRYHRSD